MNFYPDEFPHIYTGKVESNSDPKNLGRCKVRVPAIHGPLNYPIDLLPWARPVAPSSINESRGSYNLPSNGDIVWVMFEGGDRDYPVYFGGTYAVSDIPVTHDDVMIYLEEGNALKYNRATKSYIMNVGTSQISITQDAVTINKGATTIKLTDNEATITGNLKLSGDLSIDGNLYVSGEYPCDAEDDE